MSKTEENYLEVITIIQRNSNNDEDYSEIIEYEPQNDENGIVYEYIEVEEEQNEGVKELIQIQKQETVDYEAISQQDNEDDMQLLEIHKNENESILRSLTEEKFKCINRICKKNNISFDTQEELNIHNEEHILQYSNSICPICNKVLANQTKLSNHIELRHTPKNYTCDQCGKVFRSKDNLRLHMTHHRKYFYVECRACNRGYKSMQSLRYHLRQHFEHHQCEACGRVFEHKKLLLGHVAAIHNQDLQVQCRFCTRMFARSDVRDAHEREIHKNGMIGSHFRCNECNAAFDLRDDLMSHKILSHFNGVIHTCEECGKNFKKKSLLDLHMNVHRKKTIQCEICKQMFTFVTGLNKHKKMGRCKGPPLETLADSMTKEEIAKIAKQQLIEITVNPKKASDEDDMSFGFDDEDIITINKDASVKKKAGRKPKLLVLNQMNNETKTEIKQEPVKDKKEKKQSITVRNMTQEEIQEQQDELVSPQEIIKSSSGRIIKRKLPPVITSTYYRPSNVPKRQNIPLTCDICGDQFESKASIIAHLNHHMRMIKSDKVFGDLLELTDEKDVELTSNSFKEKKFACDICDKRYLTKHLLSIHKKSHANLKEFKCQNENCLFETNSPYDLNNHIKRIHNPTRPFKCSECDKKFKRRCDMINHKKSVHTNVRTYVKCPVCETIILEKGLQSHMINRHSEKAQQKPYECTICGKRERYEKVLQRHYFAVHEPKDRGVLYQCPDCPASFYRRRDATSHSFVHYEGEIFECFTCNNKYKTKKELSNHEYTHSQSEFPCNICNQVFQTKSGRGKHMKKHSEPGAMPFVRKEEGDSDNDNEEVIYEEYEMLEEVEQYVNVI
ncbi:hypothetical protein ACKWTF_004859 [Chironomus riparius]